MSPLESLFFRIKFILFLISFRLIPKLIASTCAGLLLIMYPVWIKIVHLPGFIVADKHATMSLIISVMEYWHIIHFGSL